MPDSPGDHRGDDPYPSDMEARLRVLEEIAAGTKAAIEGLRAEMYGLRAEMKAGMNGLRADLKDDLRGMRLELTALRSDQRADFRLLISLIIAISGAGLGIMAHGFHWWP